MLPSSLERIEASLSDEDLVLDVGGWASPMARADWVLDLMPYETRGLYGERDPTLERFSEESWVQRDICDRDPWPFPDTRFDFAVCSHTLEDVRDPVWVCSELIRVARAGYIEVPSRLEEQTYGVHGPWVGWSHHHWLVDVGEASIEFVFKPHLLGAREEFRFPRAFPRGVKPEDRVQTLFWERDFDYRERIFHAAEDLADYLSMFVAERMPSAGRRRAPRFFRSRSRNKGGGRA